jgi:hypothetical protein
VALGLALVAATPPVIPEGAPDAYWLRSRPQEHLRVVRFLADFIGDGPDAPRGILEGQGGYPEYLDSPQRRVGLEGKRGLSFAAFLRERGVDLVVLDEALRQDRRLRDDPEFLAFAADPAAFGFQALPIPGTGKTLAARAPLRVGPGAAAVVPERGRRPAGAPKAPARD